MTGTFYFKGNESIGAALRRCLEAQEFLPVDALEEADYVFTYHPTLSQLEDAYFDEDGYVAHAKKGSCLIDLSPATPDLAREIAAVCAASGFSYVEAPLAVHDTTIDDAFSRQENLDCCLAGDKPDVARAQTVLQHFVGAIRVTEEPGSAQLAHAAWALQHVSQVFAAIEAEALYRAYLRIPTNAAAAAAAWVQPLGEPATAVVAAVAEKRFSGAYTVEMFMADLSAALACAEEADLTLPQAEACMNLLEVLAIIGGSDLSPAALALIYDEEEAAASCGLDWSRTQAYVQGFGGHDHHGEDAGRDENERFDDDFDDFDDFDDDGFEEDDSDALAGDDDADDNDDDDFGGYADLVSR